MKTEDQELLKVVLCSYIPYGVKVEIDFPSGSNSCVGVGGQIVKTFYQPYENVQQSPGPFRMPVEIRSFEKMLTLWSKGISDAEAALSATPDRKLPAAKKMLGLGNPDRSWAPRAHPGRHRSPR